MARCDYPQIDWNDITQDRAIKQLEGRWQWQGHAAVDYHKSEARRKEREAIYMDERRRRVAPTGTALEAREAIAEDNLLHLVFVEELSYATIADIYGVSATTIGRWVQDRLETLKKQLSQ